MLLALEWRQKNEIKAVKHNTSEGNVLNPFLETKGAPDTNVVDTPTKSASDLFLPFFPKPNLYL